MASKQVSLNCEDSGEMHHTQELLGRQHSSLSEQSESGFSDWEHVAEFGSERQMNASSQSLDLAESIISEQEKSLETPTTVLQFYNTSFKIFEQFQESLKQPRNSSPSEKEQKNDQNNRCELQKIINKYAKMYSKLLRSLLESQEISNEEKATFQNTLYIWRLCEILYFPENQISPVAMDLVEWRDMQDTKFISTIEQSLNEPIDVHEDIPWDVIKRATIRGNLPAVNSLLEMAADACSPLNRDMVLDVNKLVEEKPDLPSKSSVAITSSYVRAWRSWDQLVQDRILSLDPRWGEYSEEDGYSDVDEGLRGHLLEILEIVTGSHDTILRLSENWLEGLVAIILYAQPTVPRTDIRGILDRINDINMENDPLMDIYHSFLSFDIGLGLSLCEPWWSTAHLEDLLKHTGLLKDTHEPDEPCMDEYSKAEYARYLVETYQDWPLAIEYLSHCPMRGREWIEELVQNAGFQSVQMAEEIYALCERKGVKEATGSISVAIADQLVSEKKYSDAITYYLEAGNNEKAEEAAGSVLDEYMATGQIVPLKNVHSPHGERSPGGNYWVLMEYNEFHRLYKQCGDYDNASKVLSKLLLSPKTAMKFWPALLLDALVFLEGEEMYFDEDQTYQMMACLEDLTMADDREKYLQSLKLRIKHVKADAGDKDADSIVEMLRFALSRNLARAVSH